MFQMVVTTRSNIYTQADIIQEQIGLTVIFSRIIWGVIMWVINGINHPFSFVITCLVIQKWEVYSCKTNVHYLFQRSVVRLQASSNFVGFCKVVADNNSTSWFFNKLTLTNETLWWKILPCSIWSHLWPTLTFEEWQTSHLYHRKKLLHLFGHCM